MPIRSYGSNKAHSVQLSSNSIKQEQAFKFNGHHRIVNFCFPLKANDLNFYYKNKSLKR